ncbi:MAG: sulfatase-like hydrolase/transferase, partial [Thermoanaerobaculia bacterium]|nr:sulfatase-like hydrolase/transferase [Thermoanaerobaculia bacterium]
LYDEEVAYADRELGRLLDGIEGLGLNEDTMIVVVSDHGEELYERGRWGHLEVNLHDEIVRVPLIARLAGAATEATAGTEVTSQVSTLDILPTVLDLCGLDAPAGVLGRSLLPLLAGGGSEHDAEVAICERWRPDAHRIAVRTPAHKYIWDADAAVAPALFDLAADPGESHDLSGENGARVDELHTHVVAVLEDMRRTAPVAGPAAAPELDAPLAARLRGLGYLE